MPIYIVLSKLTEKGRETIKEKPHRIFEVNRELEEMGVKVLQQYAVLGPYDFVNIIEAPDNETVMKMSIDLGSRGTVELMSLPALRVDEFLKIIKR